jgi:myo-inositol 2-dehydrogenase/D-chiro-inositol 1-dehydrogenase
MRIGIVGPGRVGVMHARNLAQNTAVEQVILVGRDGKRLRQSLAAVTAAIHPQAPADLASKLRVDGPIAELDATTDLDEVLRRIDGIVVATTTASHLELVRKAIEMGVPVLVEKPLSLDYDELLAFISESEGLSAPVMVGFHRRYDPGYQKLRQHVLDGDAGRVRVVRATDHDHNPLSLGYIAASGGIWRDLLIHDFDVIPWVLSDRVVQVQAVGSVLDEAEYATRGDADTAVALLTLASGALATVSGMRRNGAGQDTRLEVYGTKNTFAAGLDTFTPVTSTEPGVPAPKAAYEDFIDRFEPAFRSEIDQFARLIKGEVENLTPPRQGLSSLRIALAADESRRSGLPVQIEPD